MRRGARRPDTWPAYLGLHASGELARRAREALALLGPRCRVCPRGCRVDRRQEDAPAPCRIGRTAIVASHFAHMGEEDPLRGWRGSGTIFFSGCNLRCVFCQNFDISWQVQGHPAGPERLATMMLELQSEGCHNINLVTPEHVVPQILEALPVAVEGGLRLPLVYNTSSFDGPESLALLDGVVDVYMPDLKLWTPAAARRYVRRADYPALSRRSVAEMHRQVDDLELDERGVARRGVLLRHLVMPGMLGETEWILRWVARELGPGTYLNLMGQYRPAGLARGGEFPEIDRPPSRDEFGRAVALALELGLRRLDRRSLAAALLLPAG